MKTLCNLCKKLQFCEPKKKPIDMETICQIIGSWDQVQKRGREGFPLVVGWDGIASEDDYICRIKKASQDIRKNIIIDDLEDMYIPELSDYYLAKYKITITGFVINVSNGNFSETLFFDKLNSALGKSGIHLVFEDNHFIGVTPFARANFCPGNQAFLKFKKNKFISVTTFIKTYNSYKIELTDNIFIDSNLRIVNDSDYASDSALQPNIVCLENNVSRRNDNTPSNLKFNGGKNTKSYFKGKNSVDNLIMLMDGDLHWSGHQNMGTQGKHAYKHKEIFIKLMEKAVQNNDKMQEVLLRRELLKCERALIQEGKTSHSSQDKFILWWSFWISDYGISWLRPLLWLAFINALLTVAIVIFDFFNPECLPDFSYNKWWFLFTELFSPLSNLSNLTTKDSGWISFFNIAQKAILAATYYEMIKIFRRFSK